VSILEALTQNAWGGFPCWPDRRALLAERIAALRPEVVGLQEIHRVGERSQAHELAERIGGYAVHFAPGRISKGGGAEGVAILSRLEAHAHAPHALTLDRSDRFEGENQRIVLGITIDHPEGPIDVFVTHLSLSRIARTRTAVELLAFVADVGAQSKSIGAVLMGDLNATEDEPAVSCLAADWIDAFRDRHPRGGGTWPAFLPFRRLDYVFARPRARFVVESCRTIPWSGSDHLGVLARLRVVARTGRDQSSNDAR
jgi:endonuclease/exonuclease/phosphatase family metal-dependent hydrolase